MMGELDSLDWLRWADVKYPDIYNYSIATPGVTKQQLKAYKSMDGYKFFQDGWVSDVVVWSTPEVKSACIVSALSALISTTSLTKGSSGEGRVHHLCTL